MEKIFYTNIVLEQGNVDDLIVVAQRLGYELVKFGGYSDVELRSQGFVARKELLKKKNEILDTYAEQLNVENVEMRIDDCFPTKQITMEDDEAIALIHRVSK